MKVLAIYENEDFLMHARVLLYKALGYQVFHRISQTRPKKEDSIEFPPSDQYCKLAYEGRDCLKNYFKKHFSSSRADRYLIDYIQFSLASNFSDYYAFVKAAKEKFPDATKTVVIAHPSLERIYQDKPLFSLPYFIFSILISLKTLILQFVKIGKNLVHAFSTSQDQQVPKVMFLRKKVYPDLSISTKLIQLINDFGGEAKAVFFLFSRQKEKFGFYFLNTFKGIKQSTFKALFQTLRDIVFNSHYFIVNGFSQSIYKSFIKDSFVSHSVLNLGAKCFVGVLHDKAFYVLLYRNKKTWQTMTSFNECFYYPPFRGFDYCHLDVYYSMNDIDASVQNICGGNIRENKHVDFFRKNLKTNSDGISDDLKALVNKYSFTTVLAPIQSPEYLFSQWGTKELTDFLYRSLELAENNPDTLFILKGKKGELRAMPDSYFDRCNKLENMYVIHSDVPRELKHNQFEDLLSISDLLISMSHTSTTVWQAISHDIPAIGINDAHNPSFLKDFKFVEEKSDNLQAAFSYWRHEFNKEEQWPGFKADLDKVVNLGDCNGLEKIAKDILQRFQ